ncbi:MAG: hypothetical protein AABN95_03650 [Acidobacteriota bacterium]
MQKRDEGAAGATAGMREFFKSLFSFSWAQSLFGLKQIGGLVSPGQSGPSFDRVTRSAEGALSESVRNFFQVTERLQRQTVDILGGMFASASSGNASQSEAAGRPPGQPPGPPVPGGGAPLPAQPSTPQGPTYTVSAGRLDKSSFVVLGEGLAAGMGDFTLSEETQRESFAAQMARQMQTELPQPEIEAPGICYPIGFTRPPVIVPQPIQSTVFRSIPPVQNRNLSIPGLTVEDALRLRPVQPLVRRDSHKLTAVNFTLGVLNIARGAEESPPTQLEYALQSGPTFALICLGYSEALEAAVKGDAALLPDTDSFRTDYGQLLARLREAGSEVLVLTIPDPLDTPYFSTVQMAAKILKVEPSIVSNLYGIGDDRLITVHGLNEIGFQLFGKSIGPLPENATMSVEATRKVSSRVAELNEAITSAANEHGALVYDLCAFFRRLKGGSINAGSRLLTGEYLGGFYTLNGYYPGATGHAAIANELLQALNARYGSAFPQVNLATVSQQDPVASYKQAEGPSWTLAALPRSQPVPQATAPEDYAISGSSPAMAVPPGQRPSSWEELGQPQGEAPTLLQLPPGLEQTLPLSKAASYFGDGIGAANRRDPQGIQWGSYGSWLFGGLAMVDSHLSGSLHIRFTTPVNNVTRFVISFQGGFAGDDAVLTTPQFFKMWFQQARVDEAPGLVSSGNLDLSTGRIFDLQVYAAYSSTALFALVASNPTFPRVPITFRSEAAPGYYGSAWARFDQRPDGLLDFSFYGSMYAPLGPGIRWPLNFVGPSGQFATIPAAGTVMHPHLHLSTKEPEPPARGEECPEIPFNTIKELTLFTHNSSFGDAFTLHAPQLGGKATGRSHFLGRVLLQFGVRSGNSVPVAVSCISAGGVMAEMPASPITAVFPGRLYPGPIGFDEFLRFPLRTYSLDDLAILDDSFDLSLGSVDLRTGRFINELLHRGFINQDLIFALLRVEPRTPGSSFNFRGPAVLEKGPGGEPVFRFKGEVFVPYPEGFFFPNPNLTTGFPIGPNSRLDPFLWLHAIPDQRAGDYVKTGEGRDITSSAGEQFSYRYSIPNDQTKRGGMFEYENHSQQGKFRMHSLAWVGFSNSQRPERSTGSRSVDYDTLSFTCFGIWTKDGVTTLLQASAQFSTSPGRPYVGIQVDSGIVSNVNTKPANIKDAMP